MRNIEKIISKGREIDNPIQFDINEDDRESYANDKNESGKNNLVIFFVFSMICFFFLGSRIFYLQVAKGDYYDEIAENNRIKSVVIKAPRGVIKDKNGMVLATNIPSFDVVFIPDELPKDNSDLEVEIKKLSSLIGADNDEIFAVISSAEKNAKESYLAKENISYETALVLLERFREFSGFYIDKTARREYPKGEIFSQIVGYDGKITKEELIKNPDYLMTDYIGKNGLEYFYEQNLHGQHGQHRMEVDSNGNLKEDLGIINPVAGDELVLSIDAELQEKTAQIAGQILSENSEATGAAVVAIDPRNGKILSLVSLPAYDNNLFADGISVEEYKKLTEDPNKPLLNRAISGEYPPGSTFKPMVASAALEEGIVNENTTVNCSGGISVGSWKFPDWKTHGITDIKKAIADSCDVFFYSIGGGWENISGLGIDRIARYAQYFGFGQKTGVDVPSESAGLIPDESWKFKRFGEKWYIGDSYHCSIGQGYILATPLQLANYIAAVANGGTLYRPKFIDKIVHSETKAEEKVQPEVIGRNFVSSKNIEIVRQGMRQTVTEGSGISLNDLKVVTAGKTGTAQFNNNESVHSWYVSFAPYENPEIAMVVLIEGGGEGHSWAVPATKDIYKWYFDEKRGAISQKEEKQ